MYFYKTNPSLSVNKNLLTSPFIESLTASNSLTSQSSLGHGGAQLSKPQRGAPAERRGAASTLPTALTTCCCCCALTVEPEDVFYPGKLLLRQATGAQETHRAAHRGSASTGEQDFHYFTRETWKGKTRFWRGTIPHTELSGTGVQTNATHLPASSASSRTG